MIDLTIVGGGITAIALARLHPHKKILILEKSRGIGGRIATRRLGEFWIDHGAENFKASSDLMKDLLKSYNPLFSTSQWVKNLSHELTINKECRVEKIVQTKNGLEIWDDQKQLVCLTKEVVITAPAPQAKEILENSSLQADFLNSVEYHSSVQFLLLLEKKLPEFKQEIAFYKMKKKSQTSAGTFLYHFEVIPDFISSFLELDKEAVKTRFMEEMKPEMVIDSHAHKWRYSTVKKTISPDFQKIYKDQHILLAGDYFIGDDVNAAILSTNI